MEKTEGKKEEAVIFHKELWSDPGGDWAFFEITNIGLHNKYLDLRTGAITNTTIHIVNGIRMEVEDSVLESYLKYGQDIDLYQPVFRKPKRRLIHRILCFLHLKEI